MKKLLIYDHTGEEVYRADIFVEGKDFDASLLEPKAIWLYRICLLDEEPEVETQKHLPTEVVLPEEETDEVSEEEVRRAEIDEEAQAEQAREEAEQLEEVAEPVEEEAQSQVEVKEEKHEPETTSDKSHGDTRDTPPSVSQDAPALPKATAKRKAAKRDKRTRQPKSP